MSERVADTRERALARPDEFEPLHIGPLEVWPPVVLAPMAGVTDSPFRSLCRSFGAGLFVSEMITARPLVEGSQKTESIARFGPDETPRSLQLYGIDAYHVGLAVERLVGEGRVDHIDMNFGCPMPKVTRRGGGAALPAKPKLLAKIVGAAVKAAGDVPVTIKFRMGLDEERMTFLDAGRVGQEEGCAAVGLHARTAAQLYSDTARWDAIAELKQRVSIPVLGNGDIWEWHDALAMMRRTGCDGVIVGRGCLGRPWLFQELHAAFEGRSVDDPPNLGEVAAVMIRHAQALVAWTRGSLAVPEGRARSRRARERPELVPEAIAMRKFRKHASWYTKGFRGSTQARQRLMQVETVDQLRSEMASWDMEEPFPQSALRVPRGKSGGRQKVVLPHGFFRDDFQPHADAEVAVSGG